MIRAAIAHLLAKALAVVVGPPKPEVDEDVRWGTFDGSGSDSEPEPAGAKLVALDLRSRFLDNPGIELLDVERYEKLTRDAPAAKESALWGRGIKNILADGPTNPGRHLAVRFTMGEDGNPTAKIEIGQIFHPLTDSGEVSDGHAYRVVDPAIVVAGGTSFVEVVPVDNAPWPPDLTISYGLQRWSRVRAGAFLSGEFWEAPDSLMEGWSVCHRAWLAVQSRRLPRYLSEVLYEVAKNPSIVTKHEVLRESTSEGVDDDGRSGIAMILHIAHVKFQGRMTLRFLGDRFTSADIAGYHSDIASTVREDFQLQIVINGLFMDVGPASKGAEIKKDAV